MVWWLLEKLALVVVGKSCCCCLVGKVESVLGVGQMELVVVVVIVVSEKWLLVEDGWCVVVLGLVVAGSVVVAWLLGCGVVHQFLLAVLQILVPFLAPPSQYIAQDLHSWFYKYLCLSWHC